MFLFKYTHRYIYINILNIKHTQGVIFKLVEPIGSCGRKDTGKVTQLRGLAPPCMQPPARPALKPSLTP